MIRNDSQYKRTLARITECHLEIVDRREQLRQSGCSDDEADEVMCRLQSMCRNLEDEISTYERRTARTWVPAV
jgi:hypothetical protein